MHTIEELRLYKGIRPNDPDVIPGVTGVLGELSGLKVTPFTLKGYSVIIRKYLGSLYNVFDGGKHHVYISPSNPNRLVMSTHRVPNDNRTIISRKTLVLPTYTPFATNMWVSGVDFTPDGMLLYVYTSTGLDQNNVRTVAQLHVYTLTIEYDFNTATLHRSYDLSSGASGTEGVPHPSGFIFEETGNNLYTISNGFIHRFSTIRSRDLRQQRYAGTETRFDLTIFGGGSTGAFWDNGKQFILVRGGYEIDQQGLTIVNAVGIPIWRPPKLVTYHLAIPYDLYSIIHTPTPPEFLLSQWFSEYQNNAILSSRFNISLDMKTGLLYLSGIVGINDSKTVVFEIPFTGTWLGGSVLGESSLVADMGELFKSAEIGGSSLAIHYGLRGVELVWERRRDEIIRRQVSVPGKITFFCMKTRGRGGNIWITGSVGEIGSGEDLELNRVIVDEQDQINLVNIRVRLLNVVPIP